MNKSWRIKYLAGYGRMKKREERERETDKECQGILKFPVHSKKAVSKVDPPVLAIPANAT